MLSDGNELLGEPARVKPWASLGCLQMLCVSSDGCWKWEDAVASCGEEGLCGTSLWSLSLGVLGGRRAARRGETAPQGTGTTLASPLAEVWWTMAPVQFSSRQRLFQSRCRHCGEGIVSSQHAGCAWMSCFRVPRVVWAAGLQSRGEPSRRDLKRRVVSPWSSPQNPRVQMLRSLGEDDGCSDALACSLSWDKAGEGATGSVLGLEGGKSNWVECPVLSGSGEKSSPGLQLGFQS